MLSEGEWLATGPSRFTYKKQPQYQMNRKLVGSQNRAVRFAERIKLFRLSEFKLRTTHPVAKLLYRLR